MYAAVTALAAGLFLYSFIVLCFGRSAARSDAVRNRLFALGQEVTRAYASENDELSKPFSDRVIRPVIHRLSMMLASLVPAANSGNANEKQKKMLLQAGWTISVEEYTVLQLMLMAACGILGFFLALLAHADAPHTALYTLGGVYGAYAVLRYICSSTATKRRLAMEKQLPDMLDLLSVSVAAGLGFERAMLHIVETMDGPLIDEFAVTYREMSMGRSRKDALTLLGERCGVEELTTVTSALVQAGHLGIPIRNVLQSQAAAIRRTRRSKVQEKAAKVSTKILLPMIGLIFPVLIIVLMGPTAITVMEQFS